MAPAATATASIPGTENMAHETSLQRVSDYPIVKDSLSTAYSMVQKNPYSASAYTHIEALTASILARLEPIQKRLPIEKVDGYANAGLDFVEKRFPVVKSDTESLVQRVRKPADDAVSIYKSYADGVTTRLSPVTEQISARIAQTQEALHSLQERLSTAAASVPRDKASAQDAMNALFKEVESISTYITTNAKELPSHAQSAAKPLIDGLADGLSHIRAELVKSDTPLSTKATNILSYTQEQVSPLLANLKDMVLLKKKEAVEATEEVAPKVNGTK